MNDQPHPTELVHQLHTVLFGDSWARPETPEAVWTMLLQRVRDLRAERDAAIRRAETAEADADRLASRVREIPPKWRFKNDTFALTAHDQAVAERGQP